jgi:alanine racemase
MKLWRKWRTHRRAKEALRFLAKMDLTMIRSGFNHQQRKQFWQDFIKSPANRARSISQLFRYYDGPRVVKAQPRPVIRKVEAPPQEDPGSALQH